MGIVCTDGLHKKEKRKKEKKKRKKKGRRKNYEYPGTAYILVAGALRKEHWHCESPKNAISVEILILLLFGHVDQGQGGLNSTIFVCM